MFCYHLFYFDLNQYVNELTLIYYHSFNLELNLNLLISKLILEQRETNTNIWITYHEASGAFLISKEPYINWTQDQLKGFLIRRGFITEPKMMQIKSISIVVETAAGGKTCIRFTASAGSYTPRDTVLHSRPAEGFQSLTFVSWRMKLDVFLQGVSPNAIAFYKGRVKRGNSEDLCVMFKRNARGENVRHSWLMQL